MTTGSSCRRGGRNFRPVTCYATEAEITSRFRREGELWPAGLRRESVATTTTAGARPGHSQATVCHKADGEARGRLARGSYTRSGEVIPGTPFADERNLRQIRPGAYRDGPELALRQGADFVPNLLIHPVLGAEFQQLFGVLQGRLRFVAFFVEQRQAEQELGVVRLHRVGFLQRLLRFVIAAVQVQQHAVPVLDKGGVRRQAGVAGEQIQFLAAEPCGLLTQPVCLGSRLVRGGRIAQRPRLAGAAILRFGQTVIQRGQVGPRAGRGRLDAQGILVGRDRALVLALPFGHDPQHDMRPGPVVIDHQAAFKLGQRVLQLLPLRAAQQPGRHAA